MKEPIAPKEITAILKSIVNRFNKEFKEWSENTGCVANFQWNYKEGKDLEIKAVADLKLTQIDKIIYRHSPPSDKEIVRALGDVKNAEKKSI